MKWVFGLLWLALYSGPTRANAQCTGPGARVLFRETFGTVLRPVDISKRTNHTYKAVCPNDGEYTVTNRSDTMCYNAWHRILRDHTSPDGTGNMLLVNNSYSAGEFYRQTLLRLCSASSYEFSAWYINLIKIHRCGEGYNPILPNLTVRIETATGRLVREYIVGLLQETPVPVWQRLSLSFTPPDVDEPVVVKLLNSEMGGCGNDFAFDDFELVQCRPCSEDLANRIILPTAFSPNGDQQHDTLKMLVGESVTDVEATIFDRWGSVIFNATSPDAQWDGTFNGQPCQDGVYAYKIHYNYVEYEYTDVVQKNHTVYGKVLLMR